MSEQPQTVEPMPVQLTRIEGTVNLIAYQMTELKGSVTALGLRVDGHSKDIADIKLVQAGNAGATQSWRTWLPLIMTALGTLAAFGIGTHFGG
jgi:hypothetical protein